MAREHREEFLIIHCNVGNDQHKDVLDFFGIALSDTPSFMIFELESSNKYRPTTSGPTDVSIRNLRQFMKDYAAGKIAQFIKSTPLPEDWDEQPVKVLVGSNFAGVTKDPALDVLVMFYAPWCGEYSDQSGALSLVQIPRDTVLWLVECTTLTQSHFPARAETWDSQYLGQRCKLLEPVWQQLGEAYKHREDFRIAKFDATANDLDNGEEIEDFPTIILYRKSDNQEIEYTGRY